MQSENLDLIVLFLIRQRQKHGLTQRQLAGQCPNISFRKLQRIEQGEKQIDVLQLREYCAAVKITLLDLAVSVSRERNVRGKDIESIAKLLPTKVRMRFYDLIVEVARQGRTKNLS